MCDPLIRASKLLSACHQSDESISFLDFLLDGVVEFISSKLSTGRRVEFVAREQIFHFARKRATRSVKPVRNENPVHGWHSCSQKMQSCDRRGGQASSA